MFLFGPPKRKGDDDVYDILFYVGMWWRIIYGILRIGAGLFLLQFIGVPISKVFYQVVNMKIIEGGNDFIIKIFDPFLNNTHFIVTHFLAFYLIFWGAIEMALFLSLLKQKKWVFPVSLYLIGAFVIYAIYRFFHTYSYVLAGVIVVDIILLWLINKEYTKLKQSSDENIPVTN